MSRFSRISSSIKPKHFLVGAALLIVFWWAFPKPLFDPATSTVLYARDGQLLGARIADDGQWRFPAIDSVPENIERSILLFEDEYFHYHLGVNPVSLVRAFWQNMTSDKRISGGSTISMQVIRLSRQHQARTYLEKLIEIYLAVRMELQFSKREILSMYASHAPYGGNVVGIEAASWRYFQRPITQLSWAEAAMLAVLPNAPALIHLGRNRSALKAKRDRLLHKLYSKGTLDSLAYSLAVMEPVPERPTPIVNEALHLLDNAMASGRRGERIQSHIDYQLQKRLNDRLNGYVAHYSGNAINNACAIVTSVETGRVVAYIGNASTPETRAPFVDITRSPRSSGSILKPFLYALSIDEGLIHPNTLLRDVPVSIGSFAPENFDKEYDGLVCAKDALCRSLNIPAALLLRQYGLGPFHSNLQALGFSSVDRPAGSYGLTLILGGAEVRLLDLSRAYTELAQQLLLSTRDDLEKASFSLWQTDSGTSIVSEIDPGTWWLVTEALTEVQRPGLNQDWRKFSSSRKIAWKTGTSQGFRDAWAVGYDAKYCVSVWVGNADGEGRPGLTGLWAAAPLMFSTFQLLDDRGWFEKPEARIKSAELCQATGLVPNPHCPTMQVEMPIEASMEVVCKSHKPILINALGERVTQSCWSSDVSDTVWLSFDPVAEYFFQKKNAEYAPMPPLAADCGVENETSVSIIYPVARSTVIVPRDFDGELEQIQFKATSKYSGALFWHLDDQYVGSTDMHHEIQVDVEDGWHALMVMDERGNSAQCRFKVKRS